MLGRLGKMVLYGFVFLQLLGCASTQPRSFDLIAPEQIRAREWPGPPSEPRLQHLGSLYGESNFTLIEGAQTSGQKFFNWLVGLNDEEVTIRNLRRPISVLPNEERIIVADQSALGLLVIEPDANRVYWLHQADENQSFESPVGLAMDSDRNLYVTDSSLGLIFRFDANLQPLGAIGLNLFGRPTGIVWAEDRGTLLIADTEQDRLIEMTVFGELVAVHGGPGIELGSLNGPTFLSYRAPVVAISDTLNARIQLMDLDNGELSQLGELGLRIGNFTKPKGVAFDAQGHVWAAESYYDYLLTFADNGQLLMAIGGSGSLPGMFSLPGGLYIDDRQQLWVADMLNGRIEVFQILDTGSEL